MSRKKKIYKKKGRVIKDLTRNIFKILNEDSNKFYNYKNVIKSISIKEFLINPHVLKKIIKNKNNSFNSYRKIFIGNALTIKNLQRIISYKF